MNIKTIALALVAALTLGCPDSSWGPRYTFVQAEDQSWTYLGSEPGRGYFNGEPSTRLREWNVKSCGGLCSGRELHGIVPPAGAKNWPPGQGK